MPAKFGAYVEPFAGSGSLFFRLNPPVAVLGDINSDLMNFYAEVVQRPEELHATASAFAGDGGDYYEVRAQMPIELDSLQRAARFLYLNRYCFNGVYRTNRQGHFNVPKGSHTGGLPSLQELCLASVALGRATLVNDDFDVTLSAAERGDFVYLDPPYFTRKNIKPGEYGYGSFGELGDLERLATSLRSLSERGVRYLLSYSRSTALHRLVEPTWSGTVVVRRNVGGYHATRRTVREMVLANYFPA